MGCRRLSLVKILAAWSGDEVWP